MKSLILRNQRYHTRKMISGKTVLEKFEPRPSPEQIMILSRYYTELKRCEVYKRRVSRLECSNDDVSYALVEYIGKYLIQAAPHGNAIHQDTMYTKTKPEILEKIASLSEGKCTSQCL